MPFANLQHEDVHKHKCTSCNNSLRKVNVFANARYLSDIPHILIHWKYDEFGQKAFHPKKVIEALVSCDDRDTYLKGNI